MFLWIKALHIIFMVTWFAGLFYLPRLFVYHANPDYQKSHQDYIVMEKRLFMMMTLGLVTTLFFGLWLLHTNLELYLSQGWMHAKLFLVAILTAYHIYCWFLMRSLANGNNSHSHKWYRYFNELPTLLLIATVILAVVKPF